MLRHFNIPNLVKINVPGNGSCLFNSIMHGLSKTYQNSKSAKRVKMVAKLRKELSVILDSKYETLANGEWPELSKTFPELKLDTLKKELNSCKDVSGVYNELIADELEVDIYMFDLQTGDLYLTGDESRINKGRRTIFIAYSRGWGNMVGHWDLVGLRDPRCNVIHTLFDPNHYLVKMARDRMMKMSPPSSRHK